MKKKALRGKKKLMYEALKDQLGVITAAATKVQIDRTTHYLWLKNDPNYKAWIEDIPEINLDFAENALLKNIKKGNVVAQIFYLKTKGKRRGYIEKTEIEHTGTLESPNVNINIIKPTDGKRDKLRADKKTVPSPGKAK